MKDQQREHLHATIEAFDGLAAHGRHTAHLLRKRWWRAHLNEESVRCWREQIAHAERRAFAAQVNAAMLRVILQHAEGRPEGRPTS